MNKVQKTLFCMLVFFSVIANAIAADQVVNVEEYRQLKSEVRILREKDSRIATEILKAQKKIASQETLISELKGKQESLEKAISVQHLELSEKITRVEQKSAVNKEELVKKNDQLSGLLSRNGLIGLLLFFAAIISCLIAYLILSNKQKADKSEVLASLKASQAKIEEELVAEFTKHSSILEQQTEAMKLMAQSSSPKSTDPDHSLALKVADEITLIERNINLMDQSVKGIKQLRNSVGKLKDNLAANGYEIPELLGKQYHDGMKVVVTSSLEDENVESGSEIISKVIKPQINFNDVMIQAAQVEISVGI